MKSSGQIDRLLVDRIHGGDTAAWNDLIARYEGRLLAFAESRLGRRSPSEDIVQETFIGFLNSLPNYDFKRPLEAYLFSICAHKLTDHLRREGRRPTIPLSDGSGETSGSWDLAGKFRPASSIARSGERRHLEEEALVRVSPSRFIAGRHGAIGPGLCALKVCSCAVGPTKKSPRNWVLPSSK